MTIQRGRYRQVSIFWGIAILLILLWALGFGFHVTGDLIHILLVIAVIVILYNLFVGRRRTL